MNPKSSHSNWKKVLALPKKITKINIIIHIFYYFTSSNYYRNFVSYKSYLINSAKA